MMKTHAYRSLVFAAALVGLLCYRADAGPQFTFGENDKGMLQIDYKAQVQLISRDAGSGPAGEDSTTQFNLRRNRLAFMGAYGDVISIYVQTEFAEDQEVGALAVSTEAAATEFSVLDATLRFRFSDAVRINAGKFKYNFSRENLEACEAALSLDRSLFIRAPYVRTRDQGIALWGNLAGDRVQYRVDAMNGRMATTAAAPAPESSLRYSARAHVTLLDPEDQYGYKGTYLGERRVLTLGGAIQKEAGVAYSDTVAMTGPKDYQAWTADLFFEYPVPAIGTITLSAAYAEIELDNAYQGSHPDPDAIGLNGEKSGSYVKAGYLLPSMPLQVFLRAEEWRFASLNSILDQTLNWSAAGVNYYFDKQNLKFTLEYAETDFEKEGTFGGDVTKDFKTVVAQLQLVF